jgi:hypothetical protein
MSQQRRVRAVYISALVTCGAQKWIETPFAMTSRGHKVHFNDVVLGVEHMGELVLAQLGQVIDNYIHRDAANAIEVWRNDAQIDSAYSSLFRELLTYMMENPHSISYFPAQKSQFRRKVELQQNRRTPLGRPAG